MSHIKKLLRMIITGKYPQLRLRRNRYHQWSRKLITENNLSVNDLIMPIFIAIILLTFIKIIQSFPIKLLFFSNFLVPLSFFLEYFWPVITYLKNYSFVSLTSINSESGKNFKTSL